MKKVLSTIVTAALFFTATAQNTIPLSSALTAKHHQAVCMYSFEGKPGPQKQAAKSAISSITSTAQVPKRTSNCSMPMHRSPKPLLLRCRNRPMVFLF